MANETTFQPGDVVQLKSGGPLVTVVELAGDKKDYFRYYYVTKDGLIELQRNSVLAAAFHKVDPPAEPYTGSLPISGGR